MPLAQRSVRLGLAGVRLAMGTGPAWARAVCSLAAADGDPEIPKFPSVCSIPHLVEQ